MNSTSFLDVAVHVHVVRLGSILPVHNVCIIVKVGSFFFLSIYLFVLLSDWFNRTRTCMPHCQTRLSLTNVIVYFVRLDYIVLQHVCFVSDVALSYQRTYTCMYAVVRLDSIVLVHLCVIVILGSVLPVHVCLLSDSVIPGFSHKQR